MEMFYISQMVFLFPKSDFSQQCYDLLFFYVHLCNLYICVTYTHLSHSFLFFYRRSGVIVLYMCKWILLYYRFHFLQYLTLRRVIRLVNEILVTCWRFSWSTPSETEFSEFGFFWWFQNLVWRYQFQIFIFPNIIENCEIDFFKFLLLFTEIQIDRSPLTLSVFH